jgi:hypothetical protein
MSKFYGSCLHKKLYRTLDFAKKRADESTKENNKQCAVYLCKYCLYYHITTHINPNRKYEYITKKEYE